MPRPDHCLPMRTITVSAELVFVEAHCVLSFTIVSKTVAHQLGWQGAVDGSEKDGAPGPAPRWIQYHANAGAGRDGISRPFGVIDRACSDRFERAAVARVVHHSRRPHKIIRDPAAAIPGALTAAGPFLGVGRVLCKRLVVSSLRWLGEVESVTDSEGAEGEAGGGAEHRIQ